MRKCSRRLRISKRPKSRSSRGNRPSGIAISRSVVTVRHRRRCRNGGGRDEAVRGGGGGGERVGADAGTGRQRGKGSALPMTRAVCHCSRAEGVRILKQWRTEAFLKSGAPLRRLERQQFLSPRSSTEK